MGTALTIGWCLIYGAGALATWRRASWLAAYQYGKPDGFDIAMSIFFAFFIALVWPIVVPFYLAHKHGLLTAPSRGFLREPGINRRERELREREQRIAQLERELGIPRLGDRRTG